MKDAILERGQQQLKDVACVALLGLTRTRRGKKNRGTGEGEATKNLDRGLAEVKRCTRSETPGVRGICSQGKKCSLPPSGSL